MCFSDCMLASCECIISTSQRKASHVAAWTEYLGNLICPTFRLRFYQDFVELGFCLPYSGLDGNDALVDMVFSY